MKIINADCIEAMKAMDENSVDSIVTDPPYELGFMGKKWDSTGIAFNVEVWREALRVLKPGGHLLAFSGSRTYHRMAVAIEDAGFEIRDQIMWIYGSGFPKSLDISKAIDKSAGAEREVVGTKTAGMGSGKTFGMLQSEGDNANANKEIDITAPATDAAKQWQGWGTALKPAHEPLVLARKPLIGTVAANVIHYGTGGLNIDGGRVGSEVLPEQKAGQAQIGTFERENMVTPGRVGRFPANVIHDGSKEVVGLFPKAGGNSVGKNPKEYKVNSPVMEVGIKSRTPFDYGDLGSAARFFYCAKASKRDRNEGLDGFEAKSIGAKGNGLARSCAICGASVIDGCECPDRTFINPTRQNHHPTVKPTDLMQYLCRLITPPNGVILDPFMGSGSTGKGAIYEGFDFIGIEQSAEYCEIAKARIEFAIKEREQQLNY